MDEVGQGPHHWHAGEGDAEQDDMQQADTQDVGEPDPPAVHHPCVGVHLTVSRAHVHDGGATSASAASCRMNANCMSRSMNTITRMSLQEFEFV